MKFIDKEPFLKREEILVIQYLKDCFNEDLHTFYPCIDSDQSYANFSSPKYRKGAAGWEHLLLLEQKGRCCYCMRRLKPGAFNIEHVIPRNMKTQKPKEEFQKYTAASKWLANHVELDSDFAAIHFTCTEDIEKVVRFPHRIAVANFLASCNGKFSEIGRGCCCNNARSNDYLLPLMLMPNVHERMVYDGLSGCVAVFPIEQSWEKMLQVLNDDTYKEIRILWFKASKHKECIEGKDIKSFQLKDRILFMKEIFEEQNFENIPCEYHKYAGVPFDDSTYWNLFADFDWFLTYKWR